MHVRRCVLKLRSRTSLGMGWLVVGAVTAVSTVAAMATFALVGTAEVEPAGKALPAAAARTSFPGLAAARGEPQLSSIGASHPRRGQILQAKGPFDDRFVLESTTFDGSAVSGAVRVTSDVSDMLELQVLAGFFDEQGHLLGTGRFVHHLGESDAHTGPPEEREQFRIPVPGALAHRAVSVTIGVPVLVNE